MPKGYNYCGEDMSDALLGIKPQTREKDLMWDFGRNHYFAKPPQEHHQSPHLAIRRGNFKLLINSNGTGMELYNIDEDPNETTNIAIKHPLLCKELSQKVINWYNKGKKIRM